MQQRKIVNTANPSRLVVALVAAALAAAPGALYADDPALPMPVEAPERGAPRPRGVSAFGRLEPKDGVRHVAGPSLAVVVVKELYVDRGDVVTKGQLLAILDTADLQGAVVQEKAAELANARREYDRSLQLSRSQVESDSRRDEWRTKVSVLEAQLARAEAERRLTQVYAPIDGRVLDVHARAGERVGERGILELGATQSMYAIAEVYETDVPRVAIGQRARITSPVFTTELGGVVERIRPKIEKHDVLDTDPAARKDARVVEVEVRLDESTAVGGLTQVQVEVVLLPDAAPVH
jgi:HlyD family secretion protein